MVSVGAIIANSGRVHRLRLLLLLSRNVPIQMVVVVVRPVLMLMDMLMLRIVVVVEVVKCWVLREWRLLLLLLLVRMRMRISGKVLLSGYWGKVVVWSCRHWERRLASSEMDWFFRDRRRDVCVRTQLPATDSRWT